MPRPSRNLTRISVFLPADALDGLDAKAARLTAPEARYKVTRSDVIRLAVEDYLQRDSAELLARAAADNRAALDRLVR